MATTPPLAPPPAAVLRDASPSTAVIPPAADAVTAPAVEQSQGMAAPLPYSILVPQDEDFEDEDPPFPAHLHEPDMMVPLPTAAEVAMLSPSLADIPEIGPEIADDPSPEKSLAELEFDNIAMMALPQPPLPVPPAGDLEMIPDATDNGLPVFTEESRERKLLRSMAREVRGIRQSLVEIGLPEMSLPEAGSLQNDVEVANFAGLAMAVEDHRSMLRKVPLKPPMLYFYISSDYGWRKHPVLKKRRFHHGIDLAGTWQETVHAPAPGTVIFAGRKGSFGKVVQVRHAYGVTTTYAHLAKITIRKGADVVAGTVVGKMGRTGRVDGAHLHYEIRIGDKSLDPQLFFDIGHRIGVGGELMLATDTD
jgi:murein DD-endopeptidase MepM/ murein hydrolase activator NlpD